MKLSNTLQELSNRLENPEVLTNPQKFLGPNWETALRWWLYEESLTFDQLNELYRRYYAIDDDTWRRAYDLARDAAVEVIGVYNRWAVYYAAPFLGITYELIAMHLLLERGHSLTFVPLVKDL